MATSARVHLCLQAARTKQRRSSNALLAKLCNPPLHTLLHQPWRRVSSHTLQRMVSWSQSWSQSQIQIFYYSTSVCECSAREFTR